MTDTELLQAITTHGIAIRQIPLTVISTYHIHDHTSTLDQVCAQYPNDQITKGNKAGLFLQTKTYRPTNGGHWMCQQVKHSCSSTTWSSKKHNLATTLKQSITQLLDTLTPAKG